METTKGKPLKEKRKRNYVVVTSLIRMGTFYRGNILKHRSQVRTTSIYLHAVPKNEKQCFQKKKKGCKYQFEMDTVAKPFKDHNIDCKRLHARQMSGQRIGL